MGIKIIQLEMDLNGFKKNENKKESGDEQEITEQVYITNPECKDQDCNNKDELGKLSCDLCSYKCKKSITLKKTHNINTW